jgi:Rieske Fe-S protein
MECDRRAFLGLAGCALAAVAMPGCASLAALRVATSGGVVRLALRDHPGLTQPGGYLKLQPDNFPTPVYLLAIDGGIVAVSPVCKHLGCTVNIEGPRLVCPCHGSTYDRRGEVLRGPTLQALDTFPVEVSEGMVSVTLSGEASPRLSK